MDKFWAGGFLYNPKTNSVLLHKRDSNTRFNPDSWAFFGGLNEVDEKPVECFIREMKEELSVDIKPNEVIPLCDYLNEELQTYRYVFYVLSEKQKSDFTLHEGADFDWVNLDEITNYKLTEKTERDLNYFMQNLKFTK